MMKKEYIVLLIILILLGAYLLLNKRDLTHYEIPEIPEIKKAEITKITISKGKDSIILEQGDEGWLIKPQGYPADKKVIDEMMDIIKDLELVTLVSEAKNYERYDLDEKNAITVRAYKGEETVRGFNVGKPAPTYNHTFVKLLDDDRVYHARGNFRYRFDITVDQVRDKKVMSFDEDEVKELIIEKEGRTLIAKKSRVEKKAGSDGDKKEEMIWKSEAGRDLDREKIKEIIMTLHDLKCDGYIDEKRKDDFSDPIFSITVKGDKPYNLSIFKKEEKDNKYPAISSESEYPFLLYKWRVESLMKLFDELMMDKQKATNGDDTQIERFFWAEDLWGHKGIGSERI